MSPLRIEMSADGRTLKLLEPLDVGAFVVPVGFESDFASSPRIAWRIFAPWEYPEAAVAHDWLYKHALGERAAADRLFREMLIMLGCPVWKAYLAWVAVRLFGGLPGNWGK